MMNKKVSELTAEEFQKTFPIVVLPHNPAYKEWYENEKDGILRVVNGADVVRISHIGSTAVPGLPAKPMIDILLEVDGCCNVTRLLSDLKTIGFGEEISTRAEDPFRLVLGKGMSCAGFAERVCLLHARYFGDWQELYFRDYLIAHPEVAAEYGKLKYRILEDIRDGRIERLPGGKPNGYSQAKLDFVQRISALAKAEFPGRYKPGRIETR